jgi:hypothetical protein
MTKRWQGSRLEELDRGVPTNQLSGTEKKKRTNFKLIKRENVTQYGISSLAKLFSRKKFVSWH